MDKLKHLLSSKLSSWLIVIISLAGRIIQKLFFYGLDDDKCFQVQATKNLLGGHGVSVYEVAANDLAQPHYVSLIKWPPGFSLMLAPFYSNGNTDWLWGTVILDIIGCVMFVFLARQLAKNLEAPIWLVNFVTLLSGFFLYDFFLTDSSDLLTVVFYLLSVNFALTYLKKDNYKLAVRFTITIFICCLLRYMYLPLAPIIPGYILFCGIVHKREKWIKTGLFSLITLAFLIAGLLLYQKLAGGSTTYLYPTKKGFFPGNLLQMTPFLFSSAGNFGAAAAWLENKTSIDPSLFVNIIIATHLVCLLILVIAGVIWVLRDRLTTITSWSHFQSISFLTMLAVVGTLGWLSLTNACVLLGGGHLWTYVTEPRYYAAPVFFFQVWIVLKLYNAIKANKKPKWLIFILSLPLLLSLLHAIYFTATRFKANRHFTDREELLTLHKLKNVVHQFVEQHPGENIVTVSGDPMFNNFASLWENLPGLYDYEPLLMGNTRTSQPVTLLIAVKPWYEKKLASFLSDSAAHAWQSAGEWKLYYKTLNASGDK